MVFNMKVLKFLHEYDFSFFFLSLKHILCNFCQIDIFFLIFLCFLTFEKLYINDDLETLLGF